MIFQREPMISGSRGKVGKMAKAEIVKPKMAKAKMGKAKVGKIHGRVMQGLLF